MLFLITFLSLVVEVASLHRITIIGMAPFSGDFGGEGLGVRPAVDLALHDIHRANLLMDYQLNVSWVDTRVSPRNRIAHFTCTCST